MGYTDNDYFKMGAIVATGELFDQGLLGDKEQATTNIKDFLESFGISSIQDMQNLGMGDHYLRDFVNVFPT